MTTTYDTYTIHSDMATLEFLYLGKRHGADWLELTSIDGLVDYGVKVGHRYLHEGGEYLYESPNGEDGGTSWFVGDVEFAGHEEI